MRHISCNMWGGSIFRTQPTSVQSCVLLWMRSVGSFSTLDYVTSSDWSSERFSVMIQTNAQKLEISTKIDFYSHRRPHRRASCSSGTLCRETGALMCNTQSRKLVKMTWKPLTSGNLLNMQIVGFRSVLLSLAYSLFEALGFCMQWPVIQKILI
jgi:hypothetical protein